MGGELKKGKAYCLRLLSLRPRSEREISTRLKSKGYKDNVRKHLLDSLKNEGLVNDLKFAGQLIDSSLSGNPKGKLVLKVELRNKGIQEEIIEKAFSEKADQLDEKRIATGLVKEKLSETPKSEIGKGKLFRYLVSRGFDPEMAEEVINNEIK